MNEFTRAYGCLAGVALGDALGRATEFMTRDQIRTKFGWLDHLPEPMPHHPGFSAPLASVTDDTVQTLLLARVLTAHRPLTPEIIADALVAWARANDGLHDPYLGPSTRRALARLIEGESPSETGKGGTTNGAAMRVAAIGIANAGNFESALHDAVAASIPTHNTHNAIQGAAAVACAVAAAMTPDASLERIVQAAQEGARRGREFGAWSWATPLERRIELAARLAREAKSLDDALQSLYDFVGVGLDPAESVASAIGIVVAAGGDPMRAIFAGANIGGDTDTMAAIAGGICGAWRGIASLDAAMVREVGRVNKLDLENLSRALVET
ncbi:MAG: ADP-ribosylglycohydrolase family protein [Anaerolineales bacterium]|nr:ADP-ribosylglycohydrolase family protein [Anaerolineales bacterium]